MIQLDRLASLALGTLKRRLSLKGLFRNLVIDTLLRKRRFLPTWMRLGPWQMVFWVSYEQMRLMAGLGSF